jgi:hypothetical protein
MFHYLLVRAALHTLVYGFTGFASGILLHEQFASRSAKELIASLCKPLPYFQLAVVVQRAQSVDRSIRAQRAHKVDPMKRLQLAAVGKLFLFNLNKAPSI